MFNPFIFPLYKKKHLNMCGISALILADANGAACPDLFESLGLLQHRGQVIYIFFLIVSGVNQ